MRKETGPFGKFCGYSGMWTAAPNVSFKLELVSTFLRFYVLIYGVDFYEKKLT